MNKARRKTISNSLDKLQAALPVLKAVLEADEKTYKRIADNDDMEERASELEDRIDSLKDAISSLEEAIEAIDGIDL